MAAKDKIARHRKGLGSDKRRYRRAVRQLANGRVLDEGLTPLDAAFGIVTPISLLLFAAARENFNPHERARRRARGKRQRAARRAGR